MDEPALKPALLCAAVERDESQLVLVELLPADRVQGPGDLTKRPAENKVLPGVPRVEVVPLHEREQVCVVEGQAEVTDLSEKGGAGSPGSARGQPEGRRSPAR